MFTEADRIRAIELYFKYGRKITAVIRELGYLTERNLRRRMRAIYPCGTGCVGKRLPEADSKEKGAQEKMTAGIPGLTAP